MEIGLVLLASIALVGGLVYIVVLAVRRAQAQSNMPPPVHQVTQAEWVSHPPMQDRTNVLAILALVFGILGGCVAIPLGHIARSQIKRTGEGGAGMALAGLILGYVWLAILIAYFVLLAVLWGSV